MTASNAGPTDQLPMRALAELNELLWALPSSLDPHEIVTVLLDRCTRLFQAPLAALWSRDGAFHCLEGVFGFSDKKAEQLWQRLALPAISDRAILLDGAGLHALGGFGKRRLGALLAVPLASARGPLGWLVLVRLEPAPFSDMERSFGELLGTRIAGALENARDFQDTQTRSAELELLNEISQLLVSTTRLDELLARLVRRMVETIGLSSCFVYLLDGQGPEMWARAFHHRDPAEAQRIASFVQQRPLRVDQGRSAELYRARRPVVIPDIRVDAVIPGDVRDQVGDQGSILIVPLSAREQFLGAMYLLRGARGPALTEEMLPLATHLANQVSVAIANARLYEDLEGEVALRTRRLEQVYAALEDRVVSGREDLVRLAEDLRAGTAALEGALGAIAADPAADRLALARAREAAARLAEAQGRIFQLLEEGADLGVGHEAAWRAPG